MVNIVLTSYHFYSLKDGARWLWDGQTDPKRMAA